MKVTEQYFPVVLFIMLYKVDLTFESVVDMTPAMLYKTCWTRCELLSFETVDETLKCDSEMKATEQ